MKARKILLLLFILGFGVTVETAWTVRRLGFGPHGCRVLAGKFYGPSFTFEVEERHPVPAGTSVEVRNSFGGMRMTQGSPGEVQVKLRKVVFRAREEEARSFAERIRLETALEGTTFRLSTNREALERGESHQVGFETHLEVAVPPQTAVTVRNEHGEVDVADVAAADLWSSFEPLRAERVGGPAVIKSNHGDVFVSGVQGPLSLSARHGDVEVRDVEGTATLDTRHGNVAAARTGSLAVEAAHGEVHVEEVRGDLEVRAQHAGVEASGVTGKATVESSYREVRLANVEGEVRARTKHGSVSVTDAKGPVFADASFDGVELLRIGGPVQANVSHGGLQAKALEAGARVQASGDQVVLDGFRGAVEIVAKRASVRLVPAGPLVAPLSVSTTHGAIELEVPAGSRFDLEATASGGELSVNVAGLQLSRVDPSRVAGRLGGGGNPVHLTTEHGDVRVQARSEVASGKP